jgi:hypothetical protein
MMKTYTLGKFGGLVVTARSGAIAGAGLLWLVLASVGYQWLKLSLGLALLLGLVGMLLWWFVALVHYWGHAYASLRTGYPMIGVQFGKFLVLGTSIYPEDEAPLPGKIHIRRAIGGPIANLGLALVVGVLALLLRNTNDVLYWATCYIGLVSFVVFTISPLLPLGFTDGSTILHWWGK